jgi:hypothetical protein
MKKILIIALLAAFSTTFVSTGCTKKEEAPPVEAPVEEPMMEESAEPMMEEAGTTEEVMDGTEAPAEGQ